MTREPELAGQAIIVIGSSSGMGLETAAGPARGRGGHPTGRNAERLKQAAADVGAARRSLDATDPAALGQFFAGLPGPVDHVMVTGPGPYYAALADLDHARAIGDFDAHLWLAIEVARHATGRVRPGGTLVFMSGTSTPGTRPVAHGRVRRRAARPDRQPGGRGGAGPGQPHRGRLRRHAAVGADCSAATWMRAAPSCAPRCPSGAWSSRPTSPLSPCT